MILVEKSHEYHPSNSEAKEEEEHVSIGHSVFEIISRSPFLHLS